VWPDEGATSVPYLSFRDGTKWYGENVVGAEADQTSFIHTINAAEVRRYCRAVKGKVAVLAVSVEELAAANAGDLAAATPLPEAPELIKPLLEKYAHIFRDNLPLDLPQQRLNQPNSVHKIPLKEGATPVKVRPIPMSYGEQLILQELLQELLQKGYISPAPANCPWAAPIFLLKKGDGTAPGPASARWRIITDYRALNALTEPSTYVPPSVREILDGLVHKRIFSRTDNLSGFYQSALAEEDREKTTFTCFTPEGRKSYFFNVSCLGLQGAPASYQLFMEDCIADIPGVWCYIDDLGYASDTMEEHVALLERVFQRLSDNHVYLNPKKCLWAVSSMDFLGMRVSHNRVQIADDKVQGLREYPVPKSFEEVRRFYGFANYMAQFVPNFSQRMITISDLLKDQQTKKRKFVWPAAAQEEFDAIRMALIASAGLVIPDLRGRFVVETDASMLGMGAVLFQVIRERADATVGKVGALEETAPAEPVISVEPKSKEKTELVEPVLVVVPGQPSSAALSVPEGFADRLVPVWYLSRKFNSAEKNYNTRDREALAVVWALRKFRSYLLLRPFVLFSDHESLSKFKTQPGLKGKDWRHQEIISEYDFEQRYRKGELLVSPDALSRAFDDRQTSSAIWEEVDHDLHGASMPYATAGTTAVAVARVGVRQAAWQKGRAGRVAVREATKCAERLRSLASWPTPSSWVDVARFISRVASCKAMLPTFRERIQPVLDLWRDFRREVFQWPAEVAVVFGAACRWFANLPAAQRDHAGGSPAMVVWRQSVAAACAVRVAVGASSLSAASGPAEVAGSAVAATVCPVRSVEPEVEVPPAGDHVPLDPAVVQATYEEQLQRLDGDAARTTITGNWRADVQAAYAHDSHFHPLWVDAQRPAEELSGRERIRVKCYRVLDGLLYFAPPGGLAARLCVPVSDNNALRLVMLYDSHETGVHSGEEKTYARLAQRFFWPGMRTDVRRYVQSCKSCRLNKSRTRAEVGALSGLPIPLERFEGVQADWIEGLPVTAQGHDMVLVLEDRLTKFAYFVPAKSTDTAEDAAKRAFGACFCVHGVPRVLYSDRDALFTSKFFGALMALMHVKQSMGTSHYHDFNGAVESLNKTVEVMLRHLLMEFPDRDFDELLPMAQWAYNSAVHSTTKQTPYLSVFGVEPRAPMNFVAEPGKRLPPAVAVFAEHQAAVLALTRDALFKAQATMVEYENRNRRDAVFEVNEHVFLSTANLGKTHFSTRCAKLRERHVGPFRIVEKRSPYKYRLELPRELKDIYPVFHASLLWRAVPTPVDMAGRLGPGVVLPGPAGEALLTHDDDGEPVYVMEGVVARRRAGRGFQYLVKWVGYPPEENSWVSRVDVVTTGAAALLDAFDAAQPVVQLEVVPVTVAPGLANRGRQGGRGSATVSATTREAPTVRTAGAASRGRGRGRGRGDRGGFRGPGGGLRGSELAFEPP
jgi:hypothetical protein